MVTEKASVVAVTGNFAWVETQRQNACASCSAQKGCGNGLWAKVFGQQTTRMKVMNTVGAEVGDQVELGLEDDVLVKTSLAVYGVPLTLLLLGASIGEIIAGNSASATLMSDWISILFGGIGLFTGLLWLRKYSGKSALDQSRQPFILQILGNK